MQTEVMTGILDRCQPSTTTDELFKLNYDFLMKTNTEIELKSVARNLGEKNVSKHKNRKPYTKTDLVNLILNNPNYQVKSDIEIVELQKAIDYKSKVKYYLELKSYLYSKSNEKPNEHYEKPCLEYSGRVNVSGYGITKVKHMNALVHRLSYAIYNNIFIEDIPRYDKDNKLLQVCHGHNCNRRCFEPTHLALKTIHENMFDDRIRDGSIGRGKDNAKAIITEEIAKEIKHSKGNGTQKDRAKYFGVPQPVIGSIDGNYAWAYIPDKEGKVTDTTNIRNARNKSRNSSQQKLLTPSDYSKALDKIKSKIEYSTAINENVTTPCWLYKIAKRALYGEIKFNGVRYMVHILAYECVHGRRNLDGENKVVRHLCNEKACVNPEHLSFGTHFENAVDALNNNKKGVKLNEEKVIEIKTLINEAVLTLKKIAAMFGVKRPTIGDIKKGRTWKHVV